MAGDGDIKAHATSSEDFYGLLEIPASANDSEIRRAYRRAALKYHPDKVGSSESGLEKFHLLQIAHDVLSDQELRQLYDNACRARKEKQERVAAYDGQRRRFVEDLERREREGSAKRKREAGEADDFQRELKRLAEDGRRRMREREAKLRQEAREQSEQHSNEHLGSNDASAEKVSSQTHTKDDTATEPDRTIIVQFPKGRFDREDLITLFQQFGQINEVILQTKIKKKKVEGEKHRREYTVALVEFKSVVGAHAAVTDWPHLIKSDTEQTSWGIFETVRWITGREPDCLPKQASSTSIKNASSSIADTSTPGNRVGASDGDATTGTSSNSMKIPHDTPRSTLSSDESLMIRLKNAERVRQARQLRQVVI